MVEFSDNMCTFEFNFLLMELFGGWENRNDEWQATLF